MVSAEAAPGGTLSGALASVTGSVRDLQRKLASALGGKDIPGFSAPDTLTQAYADAQATQQALLDGGLGERKRKERDDLELVKAWSLPPGASLIDSDVAPFLAYNEEHFRDLNGADVVNLVPPGGETTTHATTDDSDYRVPALGRYYVLEWEEEDAREAKRQSAEHARRLAREEYLKLNPPKKEKPAAKAKPKHKKRPRDDTQIQVQPVAPLDKPEETPDKCHVCWEGAAYDDNQILYCEGCDVAVHQDCYGVKQVPKGDWYCSPCVEGGLGSNTQGKAKAKPKGKGKGGKTSKNALKKKYCVVCDVEGGALKPVAGGKDRWFTCFAPIGCLRRSWWTGKPWSPSGGWTTSTASARRCGAKSAPSRKARGLVFSATSDSAARRTTRCARRFRGTGAWRSSPTCRRTGVCTRAFV